MMTQVLSRVGLCDLGGGASLGPWQHSPPGPRGGSRASPPGVPCSPRLGLGARSEEALFGLVFLKGSNGMPEGGLTTTPARERTLGALGFRAELSCPRLSNLFKPPPLGEVTSPQRPCHPSSLPAYILDQRILQEK